MLRSFIKISGRDCNGFRLFFSNKCDSAMAYAKSLERGLVEIEKRFLIDDNTEKNLVKAGARLTKSQKFTDTYVDTPEFTLTGQDYWMRYRDEQMQLKYPSPLRLSHDAAEYVELEDCHEIQRLIHDKFPEIDLTHLSRFCTIVTARKKFNFEGVVIDLDCADFGFAVGEVEMLVERVGDPTVDARAHEKALESIDRVAGKLGIRIQSDHRAHGKLTTFLKLYRQNHFDFLVHKGVLKAES